MFTSENDRLDAINKSLLSLIGYLNRTIGERDTEIAALKDQLRAKPAHGQELEAEIERLKQICKVRSYDLGSCENEVNSLRAEIAIMKGPKPFVPANATDDTSNLRELSEIPSGPMTAGPSKTQRGDQMPMSIAGLSKPTTLTTKDGEWDWEPVRVGKIDKPAIRKVLAQGRIVSPVRTAARRAMAQQERREEGRA